MAPSADPDGGAVPRESGTLGKKSADNGAVEQDPKSVPEKIIAQNGKAKAGKAPTQKRELAEISKDGQLTGKQLKEKAKAEKAERRAKEKAGQQGQPFVDLGSNRQGEPSQRRFSTTGTAPPTLKGQHKRTGSTSLNTQKGLPLRPTQHAPPIVEEPRKENKNVALFDHLYGSPRRTSIAGASKDVHPAVLALGLQMRNYVICGSSARCVAMLLAFKRVIRTLCARSI